MDVTTIEVRRLGIEDWRDYRALRLAALADAPHAFSSTLARTQAFEERDWRARLDSDNLNICALVEDNRVGLAGGLRPGAWESHPTGVQLVSMWVHPSMRRRGVGAALVRAITEWARTERLGELRLWVVEGNAPAECLYTRLGFTPTGARQPLADGEPRTEVEMVLSVE